MRILLLGATGYIGSAVLDELLRHGHQVLGLARTKAAAGRIAARRADTLRGDLRAPHEWAGALHDVDAVIHAAATFSDDMGDVDRCVTDVLLAEAREAAAPKRFLYTGGCWLYGRTGDRVATEETAFDPLPAFAWMVANGRRVTEARNVEGIVVHPGIVWDRDGGAFARFLPDATEKGRIGIWGSPEIRWPLVHRDDLAAAYRLALERGVAGESYTVAAEDGVRVGAIADAITKRFGLETPPQVRAAEDVTAEHGARAEGPMLDQRMSGQKAMRDLGWRPKHADAATEMV